MVVDKICGMWYYGYNTKQAKGEQAFDLLKDGVITYMKGSKE